MAGLWLFIALLAFAWVFRLRHRTVLVACAGLWLIMLLLHVFLPDSRVAAGIGGSAQAWSVAGAAIVLALGYVRLLSGLRARVAAADSCRNATPVERSLIEGNPADGGLSEPELDRYTRHLVLREIGGSGQMRLRKAHVLIAGAGGLGSPVCLYLAAAGVGRITLADDDLVDRSNLQRQVIFQDAHQGTLKAQAAAEAMHALNPHVGVTPLPRRITGDDIELVRAHDLVIDGTDSFAARAAISGTPAAAHTLLIAGAISQWEGQVTLYDPGGGGPCMACLFPEAPADGLAPACAEVGVIGPLPGVVGSLMALEAIKLLTGAGQGLRGRMLIFDGLYAETRMISTPQRAGCSVCGQ